MWWQNYSADLFPQEKAIWKDPNHLLPILTIQLSFAWKQSTTVFTVLGKCEWLLYSWV